MYPALNFAFFCEPVFDSKKIVDHLTFSALTKRIQSAYGRDILLTPGCSVGPLTGTAVTTKLWDFEWCNAICPMVSKRAATFLHERQLHNQNP